MYYAHLPLPPERRRLRHVSINLSPPFMNHESRVIVIPNCSKRRYMMKVAFVCTDVYCSRTHLGPSADPPQDVFRGGGLQNHICAHPHGSEGTGMMVWGSILAADCDLRASDVGGDALRLHFLPKRGTGRQAQNGLRKMGVANDRNYTVLRFTM